jgi:hypothetical protein
MNFCFYRQSFNDLRMTFCFYRQSFNDLHKNFCFYRQSFTDLRTTFCFYRQSFVDLLFKTGLMPLSDENNAFIPPEAIPTSEKKRHLPKR